MHWKLWQSESGHYFFVRSLSVHYTRMYISDSLLDSFFLLKCLASNVFLKTYICMLTAARKCTFSATCGRQHTNNMWTAPFVSLQVNKDTKISCVITTLWYKHTVAHPGVIGLALSLLTSYELPMTGYQNTDPPPPSP